MAGTFVSDYLEVNLLTGVDLATDAVWTGTAVQVDWPQDVTFVLTTGTVTGVANFINIQGCETSDFSTADVVTFGAFVLVAADDDDVYELTTHITSKYIRAAGTIVTGGDLSASTLYMRPKHFKRTRLNSTTDLI